MMTVIVMRNFESCLFTLMRCKIKDLNAKSNNEFWVFLANVKNCDDEPVFKNLVVLAELAFTLPHSNAETERIFSF